MDIYSFIRSRAVAEHCRKINKTWDTCEMAIIISRSGCTLTEKHAAWQELIGSYPDMPAIPNFHCIEFDSTHTWLLETIEYERRIYTQFQESETGVVYQHSESDDVFSAYENALADVRDNWIGNENSEITIKRRMLDGSKYIGATFDCDGQLLALDTNYGADNDLGTSVLCDLFFIDIPAPFERGDILVVKNRNCKEHQVFVLSSPIWKNQELLEKAKRGTHCDGTDLVAWGYFVSDSGVLYGDHAYDYDHFEYYRGKLEGNDRLLHYVSLFMQDEIDLPALLNMQCRIVAENRLKNDISS